MAGALGAVEVLHQPISVGRLLSVGRGIAADEVH
jgi:hypothetical protein